MSTKKSTRDRLATRLSKYLPHKVTHALRSPQERAAIDENIQGLVDNVRRQEPIHMALMQQPKYKALMDQGLKELVPGGLLTIYDGNDWLESLYEDHAVINNVLADLLETPEVAKEFFIYLALVRNKIQAMGFTGTEGELDQLQHFIQTGMIETLVKAYDRKYSYEEIERRVKSHPITMEP